MSLQDQKIIYLDHAATTPAAQEVFEAMRPWFCEQYGNPSSIYRFASAGKEAVAEARKVIAGTLGARADEIYFTAGGSESCNWAVKGAAEACGHRGRHIITTRIEHHAVLHSCRWLEARGYEVTYLEVQENGMIRLEELEQAIRPDTILISVMFANNETGVIQPVREIGALAGKHKILFHTDAVQAYGHLPIPVDELKIDLLSASAHKLYGPKGSGFLYVRQGTAIRPILHGGAQERSRRAGTENVPGIVGLAKAAELACANMAERTGKTERLRDYLTERLEREIPYCRLNGDREKRLPGHVNVSFRFIEGESLLILLDQAGICASSGSACTSGSLEPSHVLLAMGSSHEEAHGSLRLTLSEQNTGEELDRTVEILTAAVKRLRDMSPLYEDFLKEEQDVQ